MDVQPRKYLSTKTVILHHEVNGTVVRRDDLYRPQSGSLALIAVIDVLLAEYSVWLLDFQNLYYEINTLCTVSVSPSVTQTLPSPALQNLALQ